MMSSTDAGMAGFVIDIIPDEVDPNTDSCTSGRPEDERSSCVAPTRGRSVRSATHPASLSPSGGIVSWRYILTEI